MIIIRLKTLLVLILFIYSCSPSIKKSGVDNIDNLTISLEGLKKDQIISKVGNPSSVDPIDKSLIYYSEIKEEKNIFNNKIISRNIYVISLDENEYFKTLNHYILDDNNNIKFSKKTTDSEIIKTGLIEKIFGGVGTQQSLPGSSIPKATTGN